MKKISLLLTSVLLLACTCAIPSILATDVPPTATSPAVFRPTEPPTVQVITGLTLVRLDPADGDLSTQLGAEAVKASALGQHMFVEFDASW